ncbi:MAG: lysophospholipid acyltransferase family protein [Proteobacteria bacterium]|nr:lysophospholipid acyltransferase family protein [Pseudomonadota bacterium]
MARLLMRLAALLPLPLLHAAGCALGWFMYAVSPRYRAHLRENLAAAGFGADARVRREAIAAAGCMLTELPALWLRPHAAVAGMVREVRGWDLVTDAQAAGRAIVFLTPHHGCFEISAQYGAFHFPMTIMYRPPKLGWLTPFMRAGRERPGVRLATADRSGVRDLLAAIKRHEAIGILPDQVPGTGEGEWAEFFGKPAYTMTLAPRLAARENTVCLIAFAQRLPWGRGYTLSIRALGEGRPGETEARRLNRSLEDLIRECPGQYLWGYNRYKTPSGASGPA